MNNKKIFLHISTLGPLGYLPAPGTVGTIAAIPLLFLMSSYSYAYALIMCALIFLSVAIIKRALSATNGAHDPGYIILDEVVGCLLTFVGISLSPISVIAGVVLFRLFDIVKPFGIQKVERMDGAWGIVFDDVLAAFYAHIFMRLFIWGIA